MTAIDQHRDEIEFLRQQRDAAVAAGKPYEEAKRRLNLAVSKLDEWEDDLDRLPIDAWVVAIDETSNYEIDEEDRPKIIAIRGIYIFDRHTRTHCCELTPSYYLIHLYDQVLLVDDTGPPAWLDNPDAPPVDPYWQDTLYAKYEHEGNENRYYHCYSIDHLIENGRENHNYAQAGAAGVDYSEMSHDDQMDSLRERYCANCIL